MIRATCHPERKHQAKGLCKLCYNRFRLTVPGVRERKNRGTVEWQRKNPEKVRARTLRYWLKRYKITLKDYKESIQKQNNRCAICAIRGTKKKRLGLDHDHRTGKIRGLLCRSCNLGIGLLKDNPKIVRDAWRYLEK